MVLFFSNKLQEKILSYTFTHSDEQFYVRELAQLTSTDPGNLSRELRKLESAGIYRSTAKGNLKFYSLNKNYPLFNDLKKVIFKTKGVAGSLADLMKGYENITTAFIYGSYAKEQERSTSDVDVIIVGQFPRDEFTRKIRDLELRLDRDINFTSYTSEEFDNERKKEGGFLNLILQDKIFWLKGSGNV